MHSKMGWMTGVVGLVLACWAAPAPAHDPVTAARFQPVAAQQGAGNFAFTPDSKTSEAHLASSQGKKN